MREALQLLLLLLDVHMRVLAEVLVRTLRRSWLPLTVVIHPIRVVALHCFDLVN